MTGETLAPTFVANGLFGLNQGDFGEPAIEIDPCSCVDGLTGTIFGDFCILPNTYEYCTDSSADNYCNTDGFDVLGGAVENCIYGAVEGCTCPAAQRRSCLS